MDDNVTPLHAAEPPTKKKLLDALNTLREEVEKGRVLELFIIATHQDKEFTTWSVGDLDAVKVVGYMEVLKFGALRRISNLGGGV